MQTLSLKSSSFESESKKDPNMHPKSCMDIYDIPGTSKRFWRRGLCFAGGSNGQAGSLAMLGVPF
jgi:hypothetical protein